MKLKQKKHCDICGGYGSSEDAEDEEEEEWEDEEYVKEIWQGGINDIII